MLKARHRRTYRLRRSSANPSSRFHRAASVLAAVVILWGTAVPLAAQAVSADKLMDGLMSDDAFEYDTALAYVASVKPEDLPPLLERTILSGASESKKWIAIKVLRRYPLVEQLDRWFAILKQTDSYRIKQWAIDVLAACKDKAVVMPIVNELSSPNYGVRHRAAVALKTVGDDRMYPMIILMARDSNPIFRVYALEAFAYLYDQRFQNVPNELLRDPNHTVRYYALRCAEQSAYSPPYSTIRSMASGDQSFRVREKAIGILSAARDSSSLYIFTKALSEREPSVRLAAATGLYHLSSRGSIPALTGQLTNESDPAVKDMILSCLVRIGGASDLRGLEKTLREDANPYFRALAACALGEAREKRAVDILAFAIADKDPRVRAEVCAALGAYREKRAQDELMRVVQSEDDRYVRTAALYAIRRIGDRGALKALHERIPIEKDPVIRGIIEAAR